MNRPLLLFILTLLPGLPLRAQAPGTTEQAQRAPDRAEMRRARLETPRDTIKNFLEFQNPPGINLTIASEGFALDESIPRDQRIMLARQLKQVLDGRALFVDLDQTPDDPEFRDPATGELEYRPFPERLPEFYVVRDGTSWLFSQETIDAIPRLYRGTFSAFAGHLIELLPEPLHQDFLGLALWQYAGLFLILLLGFVLRKIFDFLLDRVASRLIQRTPALAREEEQIRKLVKPISFLAMVSFFSLTYSNLQFPIRVNVVLDIVLEVLMALSVIWLAFGLVDLLTAYMIHLTAKTESKLDDQLVPLLRKTLKVFVFILGTITVIQNYGYSVTSILAGLGVGGIAIALAAKDTLSNFFGSITIFADRPFQIGDWVVIGDVEGTVEEVGFRSTRIRTFYNSLVTVPNAKLTDTNIDNMGMRHYRRIKEYLGLTYSTSAEQMHAFVEGIRAIIAANRYMRKDFYEVHFNGYGDYSLNVLVYCFLRVENWSEELREKHNFFLEILRLAERIGVEFAFPTQTVHLDSMYPEQPREIGKRLSESEMAGVIQKFGPRGELSRPHGPVFEHDGKKIDYSPAGIRKGGDG